MPRSWCPCPVHLPRSDIGTKRAIKRTLTGTISLEMHGLPQFCGCRLRCSAGRSKDIAASVHELPRCAGPRLRPETAIPDVPSPIAVIARRVPCSTELSSLLSGEEFPVIFQGIFDADGLDTALLQGFRATMRRTTRPKIDDFPVNSLRTGNFRQRRVRSRLGGAPYSGYSIDKNAVTVSRPARGSAGSAAPGAIAPLCRLLLR